MREEVMDSFVKAAHCMKKYANIKRTPLEFDVGRPVLLKLTPQILKKISSKIMQRSLILSYDGPFKVLKRVGQAAYRLKLLKRAPHFPCELSKALLP